MMRLGHLCNYQMKLTMLSPVFIGSGEKINKQDYIFDETADQARIFDMPKLVQFLLGKGLLEDYQDFLLNGRRTLEQFFKMHGIKKYNHLIRYSIGNATEAIDQRTLKDISLFIKDSQGRPYIPGSSLKGALRSAILTKMLLEKHGPDPRTLQMALLSACQKNGFREALKRENTNLEQLLLNTLGVQKSHPTDAVNSVMRGLSISDSQPIMLKQLMLAQKIDLSVKGNPNPINVFRECLQPKTVVTCTLTIDQRLAETSGLTVEYLQQAIRDHYLWQEQIFTDKFRRVSNEKDRPLEQQILYLGGGAGFISKTIIHAAIGAEEGLNLTSKILDQQFVKHVHGKDPQIGVSPHMRKMTKYDQYYYPMGQCQVEIE